jgi:hypothetical protein
LITAVKEHKKAVEAIAVGIKEYVVMLVKLEYLANKIKDVGLRRRLKATTKYNPYPSVFLF